MFYKEKKVTHTMLHQKEGKVFFILAVLIILVGYQFLQGDNFLTGAGITKISTSKTAPTSLPTSEKTTTSDASSEKTTTDASTSDTTTTEKTITPTTTEKTPLAGKAAMYTEVKSTTISEKEAVVVKEFTSTKIVLENKGTTPLTLIPTVKSTPFFLPYEESLSRVVREKILAKEGLISAKELAQKVEKKVAGIKAIEKAKVKPLYIRKVYRPFETITGQSVSDITYTGQATAGELLSPQLLDASTIMLPPQEQAAIDLAIREPLAIEEQAVDISFSSEGQEVVSSKLHFPKSTTGTTLDLHPERQLFDLYMVINPLETELVRERPAAENYYVEIVLKKENKVKYFELLGPYRVKSAETVLFSQEFRYPSHYTGEHLLTATIYQNTRRLVSQEQLVDFGNITPDYRDD